MYTLFLRDLPLLSRHDQQWEKFFQTPKYSTVQVEFSSDNGAENFSLKVQDLSAQHRQKVVNSSQFFPQTVS